MRQIDLIDWLAEQSPTNGKKPQNASLAPRESASPKNTLSHDDQPQTAPPLQTPLFDGEGVDFRKVTTPQSILRFIQRILSPNNGERRPAICLCGFPRSDEIDVHLAEHRGKVRANVRGIFRCGNGEACPFCAPRIAALRAERYRVVQEAVAERGGRLLAITLTIQHGANTPLAKLMNAQKTASTGARAGGTWSRKIQPKLKAAGVLVDTHIRRSRKRGWHPHQHLTLACLTDDETAIRTAAEQLVNRYIALLAQAGFHADADQQSVRIIRPDESDEKNEGYNYPADHHRRAIGLGSVIDDMNDETSLSPFEIAELAAGGDEEAAEWFQEYFNAVRGTKSAVITRPMAKNLGIEVKSDPGPTLDATTRIGSIPKRTWSRLIDRNLHKLFLTRAKSGGREGWEAVRWWALELTNSGPPIDRDLAREIVELHTVIREVAHHPDAKALATGHLSSTIADRSRQFGQEVVSNTLKYATACHRTIYVDRAAVDFLRDAIHTWSGKQAIRKRWLHAAATLPTLESVHD